MVDLRPRLLGALAGRGLHRGRGGAARRHRRRRAGPRRARSARARCSGVAATMRTEALVYTLVAVGAACLAAAARSDVGWRPPCRLGALAIAGFAVPWVANRALEGCVGRHLAGRPGLGHRRRRGCGQLGRSSAARRSSPSSRCDPATRSRRSLLGGLAALAVAGSIVLDRRGERRAARRGPRGARSLLHLSAARWAASGSCPACFSAAPGGGRRAGRASDPDGELATRSAVARGRAPTGVGVPVPRRRQPAVGRALRAELVHHPRGVGRRRRSSWRGSTRPVGRRWPSACS